MTYFIWFIISRVLLLFMFGLLATYHKRNPNGDDFILLTSTAMPIVFEILLWTFILVFVVWLPYGVGSWIGGKLARYT